MLETWDFHNQWHNRQGQSAPPPRPNFWPGNFCWPTGKKEARKKMEKGGKWRRKENGRREKLKNEERTFFFFFFAFHFSKRLKFVLGLPKWKFSTGKRHVTLGKKSGKMILPPQKNFPVTPLFTTSYHQLLCLLRAVGHSLSAVLCLSRFKDWDTAPRYHSRGLDIRDWENYR